jgi:hypothetical protein
MDEFTPKTIVVMIVALVLGAGATGYAVTSILEDDEPGQARQLGGIEGGDPGVALPAQLGPNVDPREECRKDTNLAQTVLRDVCEALGL